MSSTAAILQITHYQSSSQTSDHRYTEDVGCMYRGLACTVFYACTKIFLLHRASFVQNFAWANLKFTIILTS